MATAPEILDEVPQQESKDNGDLAASPLKEEQGDAKGPAEDRHIEGQQEPGKNLLKARPGPGEKKAEVVSSDNAPGDKGAARTEAEYDAAIYELTVNDSSSDDDDLDEDSSDYSDEETDSDDSEDDEGSQEEDDEDKEEIKA